MSESLRVSLAAGRTSGTRALEVRKALGQPWCQPVDPELVKAAGRFGGVASTVPHSGETLLVSVDGNASALWVLGRRGSSRTARAFDFSAREALSNARRLVTDGLPLLWDPSSLPDLDGWEARPLAGLTPGAKVLGGGSYGLAMALACGSLLLETPVPGDLASTAEVGPGGELRPVAGLAAKLERLHSDALGLRRLFVAEAQASEAASALHELGSSIEVIGLRSLADAWKLVFPELLQNPKPPADETSARKALDRAFVATLDSRTRVFEWGCVERAGNAFAERFATDPVLKLKAAAVRDIASRHVRNDGAIPWPSDAFLDSLPWSLRIRYLAHVVQSANDTGATALDEVLERATQWLEPALECAPAQLALWGAVGRAQSARGRFDDAVEALWLALNGWLAIDEPEEASFPLCELVRVLGVQGRSDELDDLRPVLSDFLASPRVSPISRAFAILSLGRAQVLLGRPAAALQIFEKWAQAFAFAPDHVRASELRWRAQAARLEGDDALAKSLLETLLSDPAFSAKARLAQLDEALATGVMVRERLLEAERAEALVSRIAVDEPDLLRRAGRVAREYPY